MVLQIDRAWLALALLLLLLLLLLLVLLPTTEARGRLTFQSLRLVAAAGMIEGPSLELLPFPLPCLRWPSLPSPSLPFPVPSTLPSMMDPVRHAPSCRSLRPPLPLCRFPTDRLLLVLHRNDRAKKTGPRSLFLLWENVLKLSNYRFVFRSKLRALFFF